MRTCCVCQETANNRAQNFIGHVSRELNSDIPFHLLQDGQPAGQVSSLPADDPSSKRHVHFHCIKECNRFFDIFFRFAGVSNNDIF
jgi:hypothetical protein